MYILELYWHVYSLKIGFIWLENYSPIVYIRRDIRFSCHSLSRAPDDGSNGWFYLKLRRYELQLLCRHLALYGCGRRVVLFFAVNHGGCYSNGNLFFFLFCVHDAALAANAAVLPHRTRSRLINVVRIRVKAAIAYMCAPSRAAFHVLLVGFGTP